MLIKDIKKDIEQAVKKLNPDWQGEIEIARSINPQFGDFSTNIALKISHQSKQSPVDFAKVLADSLQVQPYIKKLEVKEPGFINIFIKDEIWQKQVSDVLKEGQKYGSTEVARGKKARIEFVSANPTGPLHFGNARGGPIGDALANILQFAGFEVLREYLDNDRGNQVLELGKTLAAQAGLIEADKETLIYKGEYTRELAEEVREDIESNNLSEGEIIKKAGEIGVAIMFKEIIHDCQRMGINYDLIVHESDLQKEAPKVLEVLNKKGFLKKHEGALWFAPRQRRGSPTAAKNQFLTDRDAETSNIPAEFDSAVVVKSDGSYTYFASDIVYHKQKFESACDLVIDVFGSNTAGHIPKLKALALALNFDISKFKVILYQFVRIKRGTQIVKMSKRAGDFVTAREVLDEVASDALRFFILMHDADTHMDFDLDLARRKSKDNPVYYVQYAHARICSILAKSATLTPKPGLSTYSKQGLSSYLSNYNLLAARFDLLAANYELALIKQITRLPELVEEILASFAVHRLTAYAIDLADAFHKFYENCPVLSAPKEQQTARLALLHAAQIALANTLHLLGITAPEKM